MHIKKTPVCIIGTGNIGTDLLYKIQRSEFLECALFAGRNHDSKGIALAKEMGVPVSFDSINALLENPNCCEIVFDATSAAVHKIHAPILKKLGKFVIDLTPSRVGEMCIPVVNGDDIATDVDANINLVTCGGQASTPIAKAIAKIHPDTQYLELIASVSSKSAGPGTRANIDEYNQTTQRAIREFTGIPKVKSILILNPAEPPILMHNTIYAKIQHPDLDALKKEIESAVDVIQQYVPGYRLVAGPVEMEGVVSVIIEVTGKGDFLPTYSGNLDIITAAAVQMAEKYARTNLS